MNTNTTPKKRRIINAALITTGVATAIVMIIVALHVTGSGSIGSAFALVLFFVFWVGVYFIPAAVAVSRDVPNAGSVVVINLFLGWTLVGWVVALAMAVRSTQGRSR